MGNALKNAGLLDGITGWSPFPGGVLAVDESVLGAPGRAVLAVTGAGAAGSPGGAYSDLVAAAASVEAYAGFVATQPDWRVDVQFVAADGNTQVAVLPVPIVRNPIGNAARGLPATFARAYARLAAPAGAAKMRLRAYSMLSGGGYAATLLKPYLAPAPADPRPTLWDPGSHNNPDLQLPAWPSALPPFQADAMAQPIANAKAWTGDQGIPVREDLYRALHFEYRPRMRLDIGGQDTLEQFFERQRDPFYVVRPDTDQLCVADWLADGAPKPVSINGPWTMVEVGLHLEVA